MPVKHQIKFCFLIVAGFILLVSCNEPIEGCLDPNATNYDVRADENCCCGFPDFRFSLINESDSSSFSEGDTLIRADGYIIVHDFAFAISNVRLINDLGDSVSVRSELELMIAGDNEFVPNDFILTSNRISNFSFSDFVFNGAIEKIYFEFGLDPSLRDLELNESLEEIYTDSEELIDSTSGKYQDAFFDVEINQNGVSQREMWFIPEVKANVSVVENISVEVQRGAGVSVVLLMEFQSLFSEFDLNGDLAEQIQQKLNEAIYVE